MIICAVNGCSHKSTKYRRKHLEECKENNIKSVTLFSVPKDPTERAEWVESLSIELKPSAYVCELHFDSSKIKKNNKVYYPNDVVELVPMQRYHLLPGAVPQKINLLSAQSTDLDENNYSRKEGEIIEKNIIVKTSDNLRPTDASNPGIAVMETEFNEVINPFQADGKIITEMSDNLNSTDTTSCLEILTDVGINEACEGDEEAAAARSEGREPRYSLALIEDDDVSVKKKGQVVDGANDYSSNNYLKIEQLEEYLRLKPLPQSWCWQAMMNKIYLIYVCKITQTVKCALIYNHDGSMKITAPQKAEFPVYYIVESAFDLIMSLSEFEKLAWCTGAIEGSSYSEKCTGIATISRQGKHPKCKACSSLRQTILQRVKRREMSSKGLKVKKQNERVRKQCSRLLLKVTRAGFKFKSHGL